jgi:hypothetical protein
MLSKQEKVTPQNRRPAECSDTKFGWVQSRPGGQPNQNHPSARSATTESETGILLPREPASESDGEEVNDIEGRGLFEASMPNSSLD